MELKSTIEALLFVAGRPVSLRELAEATKQPKETVAELLAELARDRQNSGILILQQGEAYLMSTNPGASPAVKDFLNAELREKLTDAALETLAIVTYKQPVSRAEIESVRGVNSQYTLRHLMMRGLIERHVNPKDARTHLYQITHEFLQHLGIQTLKDLPDFAELTAKVKPPEGFIPDAAASPIPSDAENPPGDETQDDLLNNS